MITSFTKLGDAAVTLTSGSGSFIEACMRLGRSCLALEIDGFVSLANLPLDVQFNATAQRMNEVEAALKYPFGVSTFSPRRDASSTDYGQQCKENEVSWACHYCQPVEV